MRAGRVLRQIVRARIMAQVPVIRRRPIGTEWSGRTVPPVPPKVEAFAGHPTVVAIAASVRTGDAEIDTAEEKIGEAVTQLDKIDTIKKAAGSIFSWGCPVRTCATAACSRARSARSGPGA